MSAQEIEIIVGQQIRRNTWAEIFSRPIRQAADCVAPRPQVGAKMNTCQRTFGDHEHAGTCPDCGHAVIAHIGTESCVICRMEYTLTPQWRQHQARMQGQPPGGWRI